MVVNLVQRLKDGGATAVFHCCQTKDIGGPGDEPFLVIAYILKQLLEYQAKILCSEKLYLTLKAALEDPQWTASSWEFALGILTTVLEHFERVYIVLDRAHPINGERDRFLERFAELILRTETTGCQVKLLFVGGASMSEAWQKTTDRLNNVIGARNFHSIVRDQNDRHW